MSVYKPSGSPFYQFDFEHRGRRFHGSTKRTSRREAEAVERAEREKAKTRVEQIERAKTSLRLDDVAQDYWDQIGQHHVGADNTERRLKYLIEFFGEDKLLTEITGDDVGRLVTWRRAHRTFGKSVAPSTVNLTIDQLKRLFTFLKRRHVRFDEPDWRSYRLKTSAERVRELVGDELDRLTAEMRDDYLPFFAFVHASGLRRNECIFLKWSEVNWDTRRIVKTGKGGRRVTAVITSTIREILEPLKGHHPEFVFTFLCQHTSAGRIKGQRYPLTVDCVKTAWRRLRERAGVKDFRLHDFRHDFATKLLRETGNLKLVQRSLNHADLKTTGRYAHLLDSEVEDALERHAESRKISRSTCLNIDQHSDKTA